MKAKSWFNLPCWFGFMHKYGNVKHRPCERFQICTRCNKEKVMKGWHNFEAWSKTYYVKVYYGEECVGTESKQQRYCNDCRLFDEKVLE
jgi:hypothetical protein